VADVIVGLPFRHVRAQRRHRTRAVERLDPTLLIDTGRR
jgi:hypothetical protein